MEHLINLAPTLAPAIVIVLAAMVINREMRKARNGGPNSERMIKFLEDVLTKRESIRPPPQSAVEPEDLRAIHDRQEAHSLRLQDHAQKLAETAEGVRELKIEVSEIKTNQALTQKDVRQILEHITK